MMVQKSKEVVFGRAARRKAPLSRRNMAGQIRFKFSLTKQTCGTISFGLKWMYLAIMHSAMFGENQTADTSCQHWWRGDELGYFSESQDPDTLHSISRSILQSDVRSSVL